MNHIKKFKINHHNNKNNIIFYKNKCVSFSYQFNSIGKDIYILYVTSGLNFKIFTFILRGKFLTNKLLDEKISYTPKIP